MVAPMVAAAGISVLGSALGGLFGGKGARKVAKIAQQTAAMQIAAAKENRDYQYGLNAPTIGLGGDAEGTIGALLGLGGDAEAAARAFETYKGSTGYTTRLAEGMGAINNRAFAGGSGISGATLKAGSQFNQNLASGEFGNYLSYLGGLQSAGANARGLVAGVGGQATNQIIGATGEAGRARIDAANASSENIQRLIQNLVNAGTAAFGSSYGGVSKLPAGG